MGVDKYKKEPSAYLYSLPLLPEVQCDPGIQPYVVFFPCPTVDSETQSSHP